MDITKIAPELSRLILRAHQCTQNSYDIENLLRIFLKDLAGFAGYRGGAILLHPAFLAGAQISINSAFVIYNEKLDSDASNRLASMVQESFSGLITIDTADSRDLCLPLKEGDQLVAQSFLIDKQNEIGIPKIEYLEILTNSYSLSLREFCYPSVESARVNELRNAAEFLDSVIENIPNMVFVKDAKDLRFVRFNKAGENLLGIPAHNLLGKNDYDFFPQEQADFFIEKDRLVLSDNQLLDIPEETITTAFGPKKLHTKKIPINDRSGQPIYLLGISEDITARQELVHSLKEAKERYDLCIAGAGVGLWDWNLKTNEVVFSDRFKALHGYASNEKESHFNDWLNSIHPDDKAPTLQKLDDHLKNFVPYDAEYRGRIKSGEWRWFRAVGQALWDTDGNAIRMAGSVDDITRMKNEQELILAKDAAEATAKSKSMFLASMSHEIRTPLTSILGFGTSLKDEDLTEQQKTNAIEAVVRNGKLLLSLVNDILDFSKLEAGKLKAVSARVNLFSLTGELKSNFSAIATEKGIEFEIEYVFPLPEYITSDGTRLRQILYNLCSNAIKFTPIGGSVQIFIRHRSDHNTLEFFVVDSGIGISESDQNKLFKPFSQANSSITREVGGTGLGLVISRQLVSILGGTLSVQSEVGKGSTFSFTIKIGEVSQVQFINSIPMAEPKKSAKKVKKSQKAEKINGKILIAEDGEDNTEFIRHVLSGVGLDLRFCTNGKQACSAVLNEDFDAIIMDIHMPIMDGLSATSFLRKHGFKAPIIALSASVLDEDLARARHAGCSEIVGKPFMPEELIQILKNSMGIKGGEKMPEGGPSKIGQFVHVEERIKRDPTLKKLTLAFIDRLPKRMVELEESAKKKEFENLRLSAHSLKGALSGYGFPTEQAAKLETMVLKQDVESIDSALEELKSFTDQLISDRVKIESYGTESKAT